MTENVLTGHCLSPEQRDALAKKLGRVLTEEVWTHFVTGHRILICPEPVLDRFKGLIYKPRSATEREGLEMGAGWIIAVGPLAGSGDEWFPGGLNSNKPQDLLGLHVVFKSHNGVNIKTSEEDTEFGGQFSLLVMTTRDILMVGGGTVRILIALVLLTGCAGGYQHVSSGAVVETQRANDALMTQGQWQDMQRQQQEQIDRSNQQWKR